MAFKNQHGTGKVFTVNTVYIQLKKHTLKTLQETQRESFLKIF